MSLRSTFPTTTPVFNGRTWRTGSFIVHDYLSLLGGRTTTRQFTRSIGNRNHWDLYFDYLDGGWVYSIFPNRSPQVQALIPTLEAAGFRAHPNWRQ